MVDIHYLDQSRQGDRTQQDRVELPRFEYQSFRQPDARPAIARKAIHTRESNDKHVYHLAFKGERHVRKRIVRITYPLDAVVRDLPVLRQHTSKGDCKMNYVTELQILDVIKNGVDVRTAVAVLKHGRTVKGNSIIGAGGTLNIVEKSYPINTVDSEIIGDMGELVSHGVLIWE